MKSIDTLRLVVSWECNLYCTYCCNEIPYFRQQFRPLSLDSIDFEKYANVCVSGGEPLLDLSLLENVLGRIPSDKTVILYSNGTLLNKENAKMLERSGVKHVNIGLHFPGSFSSLIKNCTEAVSETSLKVRFQAQDLYQEALVKAYPDLSFRFWKMNDCDRANEERVFLKDPPFQRYT